MENKYEIKFYKDGAEIDIESIPDKYLNGLIQCCKNQINSNERISRVWSNMSKKINAEKEV